jgi:hypothetical protein
MFQAAGKDDQKAQMSALRGFLPAECPQRQEAMILLQTCMPEGRQGRKPETLGANA